MKLYCTPGGTWAGSEKDYKAAMKAEGSDPKAADRRQVDVPVDKAGLMEFLTFHRVNPINPTTPSSAAPAPAAPAAPTTPAAPSTTVSGASLDEMFLAAPLGQQLTLAAIACENGYKAALTK